MNFYIKQGAALCGEVTEILKDQAMVSDEGDKDKRLFIFDGKDMRKAICDDVAKLKDLMEGLISVKQFDRHGNMLAIPEEKL